MTSVKLEQNFWSTLAKVSFNLSKIIQTFSTQIITKKTMHSIKSAESIMCFLYRSQLNSYHLPFLEKRRKRIFITKILYESCTSRVLFISIEWRIQHNTEWSERCNNQWAKIKFYLPLRISIYRYFWKGI